MKTSRSPGDSPVGKRGSELGREVVPTALTPAWCGLTWGCGQVDALHDEQEHVIAAEVGEYPSGRADGEIKAPQFHCLPAFFSLRGQGINPAVAFASVLAPGLQF